MFDFVEVKSIQLYTSSSPEQSVHKIKLRLHWTTSDFMFNTFCKSLLATAIDCMSSSSSHPDRAVSGYGPPINSAE